MIVSALITAISATYIAGRYRTAYHGNADLERRVLEMEQSLRSTRIPKPASADAESLRKHLSESVREQELLKIQMDELEARFVDANQPEAVQSLMVKISQLAEASSVTIRESIPVEKKPRPLTKGENPTIEEALIGGFIYKRPAKRLTLEGPFHGIKRFLNQLSQLPQRVVVLHFSLETLPKRGDEDPVQLLRSNVLVAL